VRPQPREDGGGVDRLLGTIQDISEQRRAEQEIRAYRAVTEALAKWGDFESSARRLLQGLAGPMGWKIGGLWHAGRGDGMACRVLWTEPELAESSFAKRTAELKFSTREGIPGAVWSEKAAANVEDLAIHPDFVRRAEASEAGLRSAFAFPALFAGEPLAVFEFYGPEPGRLTHRLSETLAGIGRQIGTFFSRHRAELENLRLSQREREVLELAAAGRTTARIAEELYISPATVKTHFERISKRLGVHDRTAAVAMALRQGLIS
jgi:DNA-binding CsgD family transcriptional regulator